MSEPKQSAEELLAECRTMIKELLVAVKELLPPHEPVKQQPEYQRIYIVSWAPSYDQAATGGHLWRTSWTQIQDILRNEVFWDPCHDYRILTLDLPGSWGLDEINDFLESRGTEVIDPSDPREDLKDALTDWQENNIE